MPVTSPTRRWGALFALFWLLALAACSGGEADQRKAFIDFLQTRILDQKGTRVPQLTDADRSAFGDYAAHYAVIARFHETLNASIGPDLARTLSAGAVTSMADLVTRRGDIITAQAGMKRLGQSMDAALATAAQAHTALKQPDDLKAVYDKAFDKVVTLPAQTFRELEPDVDAAFTSALQLADFLSANAGKIKLSGATAEVQDPKLLDQFNTMIAGLRSKSAGIAAAQAKLRAVMLGS